MHPRSKHAGRYDMAALTAKSPELAPFVRPSPRGEPTIDFSDSAAVTALNRALLALHYGVSSWTIPEGYLCPPVPGRADYIHHAADLLASDGKEIPRGEGVRVLDVGVGANCIYPIVGRAEYGWSFVGTDIDETALAASLATVKANPGLSGHVTLRRQTAPAILNDMVARDERFDLTVCNPPFNASLEEAQTEAARKWERLGRPEAGRNFGGQGSELWTPGGETAFLRRLIAESVPLGERVLWFTTLVSKSERLPGLEKALKNEKAVEVSVIPMAQGNKANRLLAWSFLSKERRAERAKRRAH